MEIKDYLNEFKKHLKPLNPTEREEVFRYYEEFFLDSGMDLNQIRQEYGNPKNFAKVVVAESMLSSDSMVIEKKMSPLHLGWLIVLGIFSSPILLPLAFSLFALLFAMAITVGALIFSLYAVLISFGIAGLVSFIGGISILFQSFWNGLFMAGLGLLLVGATWLLVPLSNRVVKALTTGQIRLIQKIGRRHLFKGRRGGKHHG